MIKHTLSALVLSLLSTAALATDTAQIAHGKTLFNSGAQPIACAVCHTLQDAGATGAIGPDLNEIKPDAERLRKTMMEGVGVMPSFAAMDEADREAIIAYVVQASQ